MAGGGIDLLTDRERRMLRLLAGGHSVKSAAAEEGISENAANELLRSARRKLGTGSSREAARLFAAGEEAPKNCHDKSGIPASLTADKSSWLSTKGIIAMLVTALAASAVLLALQEGGSKDHSSGAAPRVVQTSPANGTSVSPGPFTLSVTFDRPMAAQSYSFVRTDEGPFPDCNMQPRLSGDNRTYSIDCTARPGARYVVYFNRPPYLAFRDAQTGVPAEIARLEFAVRDR